MSADKEQVVHLSLEHGWLCWRDENDWLLYTLKLEQLEAKGGRVELPRYMVKDCAPPWNSDAEQACADVFSDYDESEVIAKPMSIQRAWKAGRALTSPPLIPTQPEVPT